MDWSSYTPWFVAILGALLTIAGLGILNIILMQVNRKQHLEHLADLSNRENLIVAVLRELRNEDYERFTAITERVVGVAEKTAKFTTSYTNILKMMVYEQRDQRRMLSEILLLLRKMQSREDA